jgi:hypothetical protein
MHKKLSLPSLLALAMIVLFTPLAGRVAQAQRHPAYLRALSDLRLARGFLDRLSPDEHVDRNQGMAIQEIEAAIRDIKAASIDDGKDLRDHPPVDAHIEPRNRFRQAREALKAAKKDISESEDNPEVRDLRHRSLDHIRSADDLVVSTMHSLHID